MSTPVEQQLHDYFDLVDRMQGAVDVSALADAIEPPTLRLVEPEPFLEIELTESATNKQPDRPNRTGRWTMVAASVAAASVTIVGLLAWSGSNEDPAPSDDPPATAASEIFAPGGDLGFPAQTIDAGRYRTYLLGIDLGVTLDQESLLAEARASSIVLRQPPGETDADLARARWLHLVRLGGWNTSHEAVDPSFRGTGSIEPLDIDRWIDDNDVVVENRRVTEIDGRATTVLDVRVDPEGASAPLDFPRDSFDEYNDTCGPDTAPCIWYRSIPAVSNQDVGPRPDVVMHVGQLRRMWLIDGGEFDPILIEAVVPAGDERWLDDVESTVIASIDLGDDAPPVVIDANSEDRPAADAAEATDPNGP